MRRRVVRRGEEVGSEEMREVRGRVEVVLMVRPPLVAPLLQLLWSENSLDLNSQKNHLFYQGYPFQSILVFN